MACRVPYGGGPKVFLNSPFALALAPERDREQKEETFGTYYKVKKKSFQTVPLNDCYITAGQMV